MGDLLQMRVVNDTMHQLNRGQQRAFDVYRSGHNLVLTGVAGSGKSYTTTCIIDDARARGRLVYAAGSTGVSVVNFNGDTTFHSMFGLGLGVDRKAEKSIYQQSTKIVHEAMRSRNVKRRFEKAIDKRVLIVVDEVFMLDSLSLWLGMEVANYFAPLAQWVLVGDPLQLPHIGGDHLWKDVTFERSSVNVLHQKGFKVVHLKEVMRQRGDSEFVDALNAFRTGSMHQVMVDRYKQELPSDGVHLFYNNASVLAHNKIETSKLIAAGNDSVVFTGVVDNKASTDKWVRDFLPIEVEMEVVIGQPFMIRRNGNYVKHIRDWVGGDGIKKPTHYVANGNVGVVKEFVYKMEEKEGVTRIDRNKVQGIVLELRSGVEVEVYPAIMEGPKDPAGKAVGSFIQLPGHPAFSSTTHKMQGLTVDKPIILHCWQKNKNGRERPITTPAWIYVGASRVTDRNLLYFDNSMGSMGLQEIRQGLVVDQEALEWMRETDDEGEEIA